MGTDEVGHGVKTTYVVWNDLVSYESRERRRGDESRRVRRGVEKDPEGLWQYIIATHGVNSISHVPGVIKQAAWQQYVMCRQGGFESLITYREQFDAALKAYEDHGNAPLSADDSAMHFFAGLDAGRYGQMKTTVHNNMTIGAQQPPM